MTHKKKKIKHFTAIIHTELLKKIFNKSFANFPKMSNLAIEVVSNCKICTTGKYDSNPKNQELGVTLTASCVDEMMNIDIFPQIKNFLTNTFIPKYKNNILR